MSSNETLDKIWDVYLTTLDCLEVASRSVDVCCMIETAKEGVPVFRNIVYYMSVHVRGGDML